MSGYYAYGDNGFGSFGGEGGGTNSRSSRSRFSQNNHNHAYDDGYDIRTSRFGSSGGGGGGGLGLTERAPRQTSLYGRGGGILSGPDDRLHDSLVVPDGVLLHSDEDDLVDDFDRLPDAMNSLKLGSGAPHHSLSSPSPLAHPSSSSSSKPGVQFCSSHDAVSAKIAAFDNKAVPNIPIVPQIEIAPGVMARLRGAKETWECVENDFYLPTACFCCETSLFCIMDANYVLCPVCKVVSPMEGCAPAGSMEGGVGLGFTYQDLQQWQYEILLRRQRSGH